MNPCIPRVAAAQLCSSSLNYILSDSFFNSSHSIWLGCFGPTILDIDTTETTFKTLKNVCNRTSLSNSWGYQNSTHPQCEACFYNRIELRAKQVNGISVKAQNEKILAQSRLKDTVAYTTARNKWFKEIGVAEIDHKHTYLDGYYLINISADALSTHRLFVSLRPNDVVYFGSSLASDNVPDKFVNSCKIRLCRTEILPLHCEIETRGNMITVDVKQNAIVCINGLRVSSSKHSIEIGDLLLLGFGCLFRVHAGDIPGSDARCATYTPPTSKRGSDRHAKRAWDEALQGLHHDIFSGLSRYQGTTTTPWERTKVQNLLFELNHMVLEGNFVRLRSR